MYFDIFKKRGKDQLSILKKIERKMVYSWCNNLCYEQLELSRFNSFKKRTCMDE